MIHKKTKLSFTQSGNYSQLTSETEHLEEQPISMDIDLNTFLNDSDGDNKMDEHDEKLLGENLNIIMSRGLKNTSSDDSWVLASNAGVELSKPNGPRVAVFEVDGFDTHAAQGATNGAHADCLSDYDRIVNGLKQSMSKEAFNNSLIVTLTEFGRTIKQNSSNGTEHGYGSAVLMAGGLVKKAQVHADWPGLKRQEVFEGRDLNSTIDARSIYASAMSSVFDLDFKRIQKDIFWGDNLQNLSDKLFKA